MGSSASLYCFADIVGYSNLSVIRQRECQELLVQLLDMSMTEAGVDPGTVVKEDRGDARMLAFPPGTDVAWVLASMPRRLDHEIRARNQYVESQARLRVRLSYVLGPDAPGVTGATGRTPVKVVRLSNAAQFRAVMKVLPDAYVGVIVDEHLYRDFITEDFRGDLCANEYLQCRVRDPDKDFEADAWIRILGCAPAEWEPLIREVAPSGPRVPAARRPRSRPIPPRQQATPAVPVGPADPGRPPALGEARPGQGGGRAGRSRGENTAIIAAVIAGVFALAVVVLTHVLGGESQSPSDPPSSPPVSSRPGPGQTPSGAVGASTAPGGGVTVTEYADWKDGIQVYADNYGKASNLPVIPFNQEVHVSCHAPNYSGISTINEFYLIGSGPWKGTYASANEFTNGGPRGLASDPNVDGRVRPC